jgi:hypothetical protein
MFLPKGAFFFGPFSLLLNYLTILSHQANSTLIEITYLLKGDFIQNIFLSQETSVDLQITLLS